MYPYSECLNIIEGKITNLHIAKQPENLYKPISYLLELGGKRIRPCLTLLACNLFSEKIDQAIDAALGIEIFHNFTLMHDDIMDNADVRRNQVTVHKKWNENTAILSGDAMFTLAYQYIAKTKDNHLVAVLSEFNKVAMEVCEGQQYDMDFETIETVSEALYLNMIRLKTAVLLASSLKIGGLIGGANKNDLELLYDFGINIGLGFQLQDDLLDSYGNESFGKKIGGDIVANKKTFLMITAIDKTQGNLSNRLSGLLSATEIDPNEKVSQVLEIYDQVGVKSSTEKRIQSYFKKAQKDLDAISVKTEKKKELKKILDRLMGREN